MGTEEEGVQMLWAVRERRLQATTGPDPGDGATLVGGEDAADAY